jgi:hypothetical protein
MANKDQPQGARAFGPVLRIGKYLAAGATYPGEFVNMDADGKVKVAAASQALLGVALSQADADGELLVADHPDQRYVIQSDDASVSAQTAVNLNYNILATAEDTKYKISRMELDGDTGDTTATLPLKLLGIADKVDNDFGANVECIVKINNHQLSAHTGTAGV